MAEKVAEVNLTKYCPVLKELTTEQLIANRDDYVIKLWSGDVEQRIQCPVGLFTSGAVLSDRSPRVKMLAEKSKEVGVSMAVGCPGCPWLKDGFSCKIDKLGNIIEE